MNTHGPRRASGPRPPHLKRSARGSNPLRRPTDRAQSWFAALFLLILVLGLPAASLSAGRTAYASQMRVVHAESAARHQITARLAAASSGPPHRSGGRETWQARVHWTGEDGAARTGMTTVAQGVDAGDEVLVWVDRHGALTRPPASRATAVTLGWFTGCVTAAAVATAVLLARVRVGQVLDRRRYAQWDAEWKVVEPAWSGRNRRR